MVCNLQIRSEGPIAPYRYFRDLHRRGSVCLLFSEGTALSRHFCGLAPPQPTLHMRARDRSRCGHPFSASTAPAFPHSFTPASQCWAPGAHKSVLSKRSLNKIFCLLVCFEQMRNSGVEVTESQISAQMEHLSNIQRPTCNSFQHQSRMLASFNQPFLCWSVTRDS